jgi:hypothetical protein
MISMPLVCLVCPNARNPGQRTGAHSSSSSSINFRFLPSLPSLSSPSPLTHSLSHSHTTPHHSSLLASPHPALSASLSLSFASSFQLLQATSTQWQAAQLQSADSPPLPTSLARSSSSHSPSLPLCKFSLFGRKINQPQIADLLSLSDL